MVFLGRVGMTRKDTGGLLGRFSVLVWAGYMGVLVHKHFEESYIYV